MKLTDRRFCVYFYKQLSTNKIVYVGHGSYGRQKTKNQRNSNVHNLIASGDYEIIIAFDFLTKIEAESIENEYLQAYLNVDKDGFLLLNKRGPSKSSILTYNEVFDNFYIDETSPTLLRWKVNKYGGTGALLVQAGAVAGSLENKRKYHKVSCNGKRLRISRVLYCLYNKCDLSPNLYIDHIDRNPGNNSKENLRAVTPQENRSNSKRCLRQNSSSGVLGVNKAIGKKGSYFWIARFKFSDGNKRTEWSKKFSIEKYGNDLAFELACNARKEFEVRYEQLSKPKE